MQRLLAHLRSDGILAGAPYRLRRVTHLDVTEEGAQRAVESIRRFFGSGA